MKTLGILGAISPAHFQEGPSSESQVVGGGSGEGEEKEEESEGIIGEDYYYYYQGGMVLEDYYPIAAIRALMRILRDPQSGSHCQTALQTMMLICKRISQPYGSTSGGLSSGISGGSGSTKSTWRPGLTRLMIAGFTEAIKRADTGSNFKVSRGSSSGIFGELTTE